MTCLSADESQILRSELCVLLGDPRILEMVVEDAELPCHQIDLSGPLEIQVDHVLDYCASAGAATTLQFLEQVAARCETPPTVIEETMKELRQMPVADDVVWADQQIPNPIDLAFVCQDTGRSRPALGSGSAGPAKVSPATRASTTERRAHPTARARRVRRTRRGAHTVPPCHPSL